MAFTDINSEDRLVQKTFADHLRDVLGWDCVYAWNEETFGPEGTLGRSDTKEVVLVRDLREAIIWFNPELPEKAVNEAIEKLTRHDFSRSAIQHNQAFCGYIRDGVPVSYRDAKGQVRRAFARVIDFRRPENNRFLCVREPKITGLRTPNYNRRADLVCFVNGLPLVFIELKAVYKNIRAGFDGNLHDYLDEHVIAHAFHHNAFLIVSNEDRARYGSITSAWDHFAEWKRQDERDKGSVDAEALLNGMLAKERLLDIVENFILFDAGKPGATRKIVARNHQILGVNRAVASVIRQEALKREFPPGERLRHRVIELPLEARDYPKAAEEPASYIPAGPVDLVERAHPELGKLGVFWHTQGSGKSYSMAFFAEKVRRIVPGNFTFVLMTDRNDLDSQIYKTFVGCGVADDQTPRAGSGKELERLLKENHRYVFSLIHKFNQDVNPKEPYSERDDIVVISDEAHRTQGGKLARNMRVALPNAAFIGFTGTPLFKHDELTKRVFGDYVSRYDFKRSEEDGATVKLVYENRGEKLGVARLDLNDRIADAVEAVYTSDESKRRFEILARQVFTRFKALLMEPAAFAYAERHDNIEAVYKKLSERRDTADVTELLKELHRIVNEAIRTQEPGDDQTQGLTFDLSRIDLEKLRDEFAQKLRRKATALQDIREIVEQKLAEMLERNPQRMDYYKRYQEIVADYNREKDRVNIEETFEKLLDLVNSLDEEQRRAAEEGLDEDELALFDLLKKENLGKAEREKVKQASQALLASLRELLAPLERWTEKEQTQAEVETFILDNLYRQLPSPPFTDEEKQAAAKIVYQHVWQQSVSGAFGMAA